MKLKTIDLTIEARVALLQSQISNPETLPPIPADISGIPDTEIPTTQFLKTISKITF